MKSRCSSSTYRDRQCQYEIASDGNVVGIPVSARLLANVEHNSRILTPNNDGINDRLGCAIDLINVLDPRPMILRIYDLSGAVVFEDRMSPTMANTPCLGWSRRITQLVTRESMLQRL